MLPKCQHTFCQKCILTFLNKNGKTSIKLVKLGQKQLVSEYFDLRSSPSQTPAEFFHQSGYTVSLFHECNVSVDGRLQAGQVTMSDKLQKYCNSNQDYIEPVDVFTRMFVMWKDARPLH